VDSGTDNDFEESKRQIADCWQLFFMADNAPITLQTDASDFENGGYLFQTVDGLLQVIMCISKRKRMLRNLLLL